jgi:hypothetical protein
MPGLGLDLNELIEAARLEHIENGGLGGYQHDLASLGLRGLGRDQQHAQPSATEKIEFRKIDGN